MYTKFKYDDFEIENSYPQNMYLYKKSNIKKDFSNYFEKKNK